MSSVTEKRFAMMTEAEVWDFAEKDIEVFTEVYRLMRYFSRLYLSCSKKHGSIPPEIMFVSARYPIERVAVIKLVNYHESKKGISKVAVLN